MEKKHKIILGIVVFIVAFTTIGLIVFPSALTTPTIPPPDQVPPRNDLSDPVVTGVDGTVENDISDLIVVDSQQNGDSISSPVTITGKARGAFYFEGTFPVEIINENTRVDFGRGVAKAQGDWQTEDFVPFVATIAFDKPSTPTPGTIFLKNDNPSGDPANDKSLSIPVIVK